ncbi:DUF3159 domain-containing protein [Haematomicrobium sanguinis]|uniref:DUF3159 domain-containing protein n=1 Tax=Haematomicrobium sanguinis TaxID=479106 RepID=UPI0005551A0E|nr:DUF3159 domain-containing protein [Haematomicrobium sanguinis]
MSATPPENDQPKAFWQQVSETMASKSGVKQGEDGQIDVLASIGGVRGIIESVAPAFLFIVLYTITSDLWLSVMAAVATAAVLTVIRLIQRDPFMQAVGSLIGVAICAFVANQTGEARDYFVPGFFMSGGTVVVLVGSMIAKWPLLGVAFGYLRGEGLEWRQLPARMRVYQWATSILAAAMLLRLIVQVPLYLTDNVTALGASRLAMGVPLYALAVWIAWIVSSPRRGTRGAKPPENQRGSGQ